MTSFCGRSKSSRRRRQPGMTNGATHHPSEAGGPAPSGSPHPSLPPGAPSSSADIHILNVSFPAATDWSAGLWMASPRTTISGPAKRPAPRNSAPAPLAKKARSNAYNVFCRGQRPLLPPRLPNAERERRLSLQWKALSAAEKAEYVEVQSASPPECLASPRDKRRAPLRPSSKRLQRQ